MLTIIWSKVTEFFTQHNKQILTFSFFKATLFRGGGVCKFAHPYLDVTKRKTWGVGAPNFLTFNIIILDILCEKLACLGPPLQIL